MTKKTALLTLILVFSAPLTSEAVTRDCEFECPISAANKDPSEPFYRVRQTCLNKCIQENARFEVMEEQTDLLQEQVEEQRQLEDQVEENPKRREVPEIIEPKAPLLWE